MIKPDNVILYFDTPDGLDYWKAFLSPGGDVHVNAVDEHGKEVYEVASGVVQLREVAAWMMAMADAIEAEQKRWPPEQDEL